MERNLISREHAYRSGPRGVVVGDDEMMSVMVNEEDHIRLQVIRSGLCLRDTWCMIDILDSDLGSLMGYAFSDRLGFLTACPTNLGTGLRASVMVHLPALSLIGQLRSALDEVRGLGLSARGLHGEGTRVTGDMLQLSNRTTLGKSEEDTISQVERAARRMVSYEERARHSLWQRSRAWVEDKVRASAETLFDSGSLSTEEGLSYLSIMRLGIYLGLISPIDSSKLNGLFILIQPAHLQKIAGVRMEAVERDEARAALIRGQLRRGLREALREPA
jgi:protein arginine kinase